MSAECPACDGKGVIRGHLCQVCNGTGSLWKSRITYVLLIGLLIAMMFLTTCMIQPYETIQGFYPNETLVTMYGENE